MTTTREQRLRELVEKWREEAKSCQCTTAYMAEYYIDQCADELAAILDEEVEITDSMLRLACDAYDEHQTSLEGYSIPMAMHAALAAALKEPGQ